MVHKFTTNILLFLLPVLSTGYRIKTLRSPTRSYPSHFMSSSPSLEATDGQNFARLGCQGTYDKSSFSILNGVCDRCYDLFKDHDVHSLCRSNCFTSSYFNTCLTSLLLVANKEYYDQLGANLG